MVHNNMVLELHMEYQLHLSVDVFKGLLMQFLPICFQILLSGLIIPLKYLRYSLKKVGFQFLCVAGCIDGTLINIDAPSTNGEPFVDRHVNHSINVTMVCGPNHVFYAVDANLPGSVHDARVLRNTNIFAEEDSLKDTLDQEEAPNVGAIMRVNTLLDYFRQRL
ncbi:unnamed protein product [Macrosiphum euphorbiae]|uniref:DDE Tnp4 domain-containing protein n=1 Tax=Macrosiphum euphorbiae TaxID=13131 RepID=A0AAV0WFH5_9HEMI|nr:unnamed protein product [Macrosiphum euphorbiae]